MHSLHSKSSELFINIGVFRFRTTNEHSYVRGVALLVFSETSTEEVSVSLLSVQREQHFASGGVSDQGGDV